MNAADMPVQMFYAARKRRTTANDASFLMRLPAEMKKHLLMCAAINCRSANEEFLARLQESIDGESIDAHGVIVTRRPSADK